MPTATQIDFSATELADSYTGFYAKIVDDVFTIEECRALVDLAASADGGWQAVGESDPNTSRDSPSNFRFCQRILRFDEETAKIVFERLKPFVEDDLSVIDSKSKWAGITGKVGRKYGPTWELRGVNSRLSFLKYSAGHFFQPHCDGLVNVDNLKSFVTLHLYLTDRDISKEGSDGTLNGGCTRFWTPNKKHHLDVEPKVGRVLIFQQRMMVHSGEPVSDGSKYTMRSDFMFEMTKSQ